MSPDEAPPLSVVMPVRDDAAHLEAAVEAVLRQSYPRPFEVILAVGPSRDGTEDVARRLARSTEQVRVVDNPKGTTPAGLNAAIAASTGDIIARVDSHAELSPGYLPRAVDILLETGADNVGGIQHAEGLDGQPMQQAIAAAMSSRFGVGDAKFHYGGAPGPTDTVYLGVFRRSALERVGGFDERYLRNQDYELNWRIRESGGVVYFHPDLVATYRPRDSLRGLVKQYFEYGRWKRAMLQQHPGSVRWRQLVPPATLVMTMFGLMAAVVWPVALTVPGAYLVATTAAALLAPAPSISSRVRLPVVFASMHYAWAAGFLTFRHHPEKLST